MPQLDAGEPIWTVDTSIVKPDREAHFLKNCGALGPGKMTVCRDLENASFFWSPAKWTIAVRLMRGERATNTMLASRQWLTTCLNIRHT
jgi:hypothetical protein